MPWKIMGFAQFSCAAMTGRRLLTIPADHACGLSVQPAAAVRQALSAQGLPASGSAANPGSAIISMRVSSAAELIPALSITLRR